MLATFGAIRPPMMPFVRPMMLDGNDLLMSSLDHNAHVAPMTLLAKSDLEKGFGEIMIYFPLVFTGFAVLVFGVQFIAGLFRSKRPSNFD